MRTILASGKEVLVDDEDFEELAKIKWRVFDDQKRTTNYVVARINIKIDGKWKTKGLLMHRIVMKAERGQIIDHINRNPLDNRKENLRFASVNESNRHKPMPRKGPYRGVKLANPPFGKTFQAMIRVNKKRENIGSFKTAIAAAHAYDLAAKIFHGKFAILNFPENR